MYRKTANSPLLTSFFLFFFLNCILYIYTCYLVKSRGDHPAAFERKRRHLLSNQLKRERTLMIIFGASRDQASCGFMIDYKYGKLRHYDVRRKIVPAIDGPDNVIMRLGN